MLFGRVRGTAICTIKYRGTEGVKLLVVQPLNKRLEPIGNHVAMPPGLYRPARETAFNEAMKQRMQALPGIRPA